MAARCKCERCGVKLPYLSRKRLVGQHEFKRNEWTSKGFSLYVCDKCYYEIITELSGGKTVSTVDGTAMAVGYQDGVVKVVDR